MLRTGLRKEEVVKLNKLVESEEKPSIKQLAKQFNVRETTIRKLIPKKKKG